MPTLPTNRKEYREIYGLPSSVEDLIEHLDLRYPNRCIAPGTSIERAHREAGNREVVDYLLSLKNEDGSVVVNDPIIKTIKTI